MNSKKDILLTVVLASIFLIAVFAMPTDKAVYKVEAKTVAIDSNPFYLEKCPLFQISAI